MRLPVPLAAIILLSAAVAAGQEWTDQVRALRPRNTAAEVRAVLDSIDAKARESLASIHHSQTPEEARRALPGFRANLQNSLGFRRLAQPVDLHARTVGILRRHGYRIEKIVYQTLPDVLIPAHLYIPEGLQGKAPGIIFYTGHWWPDSKARPDFQAFCITLARLGFVVLNFDALGQGERGVSARDHRRLEALLVGVSTQGIAEYETQAAIQYLLSRKEVDPARVGMTGASGGGYTSWMTTALDDRIRVAVPVVGTSEFYQQLHELRDFNWYNASEHCHFVPNLIRFANNHDFLAAIAPRPLLIVSAREDRSFPVEGVRQVVEYGKRLYQQAGHPERIGYYEDSSSGHGYQQKKREAAYGWFLKWLMERGDGQPYAEPATQTVAENDPELRCFPAGENHALGPGLMAAVRKMAGDLPPGSPSKSLDDVLGKLPQQPPFPLTIRDMPVQRLEIPSEDAIRIPAFLVMPQGALRGVLFAVDDKGKEALTGDPILRDALAGGWALCGLDPRGIGESANDKMGWVYGVSTLLGENFIWRQGWDIRHTVQSVAASAPLAGRSALIYARGHDAALAATYALAQGMNVRAAILREGFLRFHQFVDRPKSTILSYRLIDEDRDRLTAYDREIPFPYFVFNGLRSFDLPQLLKSAPAKILVVDPMDGDWERMTTAAAREIVGNRVQVVSNGDPQSAARAFLREVH